MAATFTTVQNDSSYQTVKVVVSNSGSSAIYHRLYRWDSNTGLYTALTSSNTTTGAGNSYTYDTTTAPATQAAVGTTLSYSTSYQYFVFARTVDAAIDPTDYTTYSYAYPDNPNYPTYGSGYAVTTVAAPITYYTVTFSNANGSTGTTTKSVASGSTTTFPDPGTRSGYNFASWSPGGYAAGANTPTITSAVTYTATWTSATTPPSWTDNTLTTSGQSAILNRAYVGDSVSASGTPAPTFSVTSGSLPPGITISSSGVISGTKVTGIATGYNSTTLVNNGYTATITATNSAGSITTNVTITVYPDGTRAVAAGSPVATPLTIARRWDGYAWVNITIMRRWDGTWADISTH
jgi:hypothetical protein